MVCTHAIEGSNPRHSTMRVWPSGRAPGRQPGEVGSTPTTRSTEGCQSLGMGRVANAKPGVTRRKSNSSTLRHREEDAHERDG